MTEEYRVQGHPGGGVVIRRVEDARYWFVHIDDFRAMIDDYFFLDPDGFHGWLDVTDDEHRDSLLRGLVAHTEEFDWKTWAEIVEMGRD